MKKILKNNCIIGGLLSFFLVFGLVNVVNGAGKKIIIDTVPKNSKLHTVSVHSLFLTGNNGYSMLISTGMSSTFSGYLYVGSGLIVGSGNSANSENGVVIGGGLSNTVNGGGVGIGGGRSNTLSGLYGVVGGGLSNTVTGNVAGIGGGRSNKVGGLHGVVAGGYNNNVGGDNAVVLGGMSNKVSGNNSLVLGQNSSGASNSFVWGEKSWDDEARIKGASGVLIGTYNSITGVKLVISGVVKLGLGLSGIGEINVNSSGCIQSFDGSSPYVLGRSSEIACKALSGCQFGKTMMHNGDIVTGYAVPYSEVCSGVILRCDNGNLKKGNNIHNDYYPYCYVINSNPRRPSI